MLEAVARDAAFWAEVPCLILADFNHVLAENAQQKRFLRSGAWFDCRLLGTPVMRKCLVHGGSR